MWLDLQCFRSSSIGHIHDSVLRAESYHRKWITIPLHTFFLLLFYFSREEEKVKLWHTPLLWIIDVLSNISVGDLDDDQTFFPMVPLVPFNHWLSNKFVKSSRLLYQSNKFVKSSGSLYQMCNRDLLHGYIDMMCNFPVCMATTLINLLVLLHIV